MKYNTWVYLGLVNFSTKPALGNFFGFFIKMALMSLLT